MELNSRPMLRRKALFLGFLALAICLSSCGKRNASESTNIAIVLKHRADSLLAHPCQARKVEDFDLWEATQEIPFDTADKVLWVKELQSRGFVIVANGRGNWQEGPRILSFALLKENCRCQVDKLYYSPDEQGWMRVSERVVCGLEGSG